jgi:hypothetical protein
MIYNIVLLETRRLEYGDIHFVITSTWFEFHRIALWLFRRFLSIPLFDLLLQFISISAIIILFRDILIPLSSLEFKYSLRRGFWFRSSGMWHLSSLLRSASFWVITRRRVVIPYRRFGTTYRSHHQGSGNPGRKAFALDCLTLEDETGIFSRNVGKELPLYAA